MEVFLMNKKVTITLLSAFLCAGSITNGMESALVPVAKVATKSIASVVEQIAQHKDAITVGGTLGTGAVLAAKSILNQKATEKAAKIKAAAKSGIVSKTLEYCEPAIILASSYIVEPLKWVGKPIISGAKLIAKPAINHPKTTAAAVGAFLLADMAYKTWLKFFGKEIKEIKAVDSKVAKKSLFASTCRYLGRTYDAVSPCGWANYLVSENGLRKSLKSPSQNTQELKLRAQYARLGNQITETQKRTAKAAEETRALRKQTKELIAKREAEAKGVKVQEKPEATQEQRAALSEKRYLERKKAQN